MPSRRSYRGIRSVMETPLMDERKWAKIPDIPADVIFIDLEDSLPPGLKEAGRQRAVEVLGNLDLLSGRVVLCRPNSLDTPWGRDDIQALGEAGAECVALPKLRSLEDVQEAQELFSAAGAEPDFFAIIETAQAVLEAARIAAHERVAALMFGAGDLTVDSGIPLLGPDRELNPAILPAKLQAVLAGAAFGKPTTDIAFLPDIRDLDEVRRRYGQSRQLGFTTGVTFYPPHVPIINEVFSPSVDDVRDAEMVINEYEAAVAAGNPAVTLSTGRVLLVHDYDKALKVRDQAAAVAGMAAK